MSNSTFNEHLSQVLKSTHDIVDSKTDAATDLKQLVREYFNYVDNYQKIQKAHDFMVHPQKRQISKELLTAMMIKVSASKMKILQTKNEPNTKLAELLVKSNLTPENTKTAVSVSLKADINRKKSVLDTIFQNQNIELATMVRKKQETTLPDMDIEQAVLMIQTSERGRQSKLRAAFMKELKQRQSRKAYKLPSGEPNFEMAARVVQRNWRSFVSRRKFPDLVREENRFAEIQMDNGDKEAQIANRVNNNEQRRRQVQVLFEKNYEKALVDIEQGLASSESNKIKENILEQFRSWCMENKKATGAFPNLPPEEQWQSPNFDVPKFFATIGAIPTEVVDTKVDQAPEEDKTPHHIQWLKSCLNIWEADWATRDEDENFEQKHDSSIIIRDKRKILEQQIKNLTYSVLETELASLKAEFEKGGGKSKKKDKKAGGKKGKKGKGDEEKNIKIEDVAADLTRLAQLGVIMKPRKCSLSDFVGDSNHYWDDKGFSILSQGDIRQVSRLLLKATGSNDKLLTELCVFPLSSDKWDDSVRTPCSIAVFGPEGTGKTMLVNALCNETSATLFNISPSKLGQPDILSSLSQTVVSVFKMAKIVSPSVIFLDEADMVFAKKAPKDAPIDVKILKKDLTKCMKSLKPSDRVLLVARCVQPFELDTKSFGQMFERILFCPRPDYQTRRSIWQNKIRQSTNEVGNIDFSLLAKLSDGLSAGQINAACEEVLSSKRLRTIEEIPLKADEFLQRVGNLPVEKRTEDRAYIEWYQKSYANK